MRGEKRNIQLQRLNHFGRFSSLPLDLVMLPAITGECVFCSSTAADTGLALWINFLDLDLNVLPRVSSVVRRFTCSFQLQLTLSSVWFFQTCEREDG